MEPLSAFANVGWVAVVIATLASSVLGGVWFTALFGKTYAVALGREAQPQTKPGPLFIFGPLACGLVTTVTSALLMRSLDVNSVTGAVTFGATVGLGYVVATMTNTAINPNFPRPFLYSAVCGPYFLLSSMMTAVILVLMR